MPFEPFRDAAGLGGRERRVEAGRSLGVQIILNPHNFVCFWEMDIGQIAQHMGIIDRSAPVVAPPSSDADSMNRLATPLRSYS